jgi:hypothetical protein
MTTSNPGCEKEWGRDTNKEIKQQGGYTIEFWVNIDSKATIPNTNEVVLFLYVVAGDRCTCLPSPMKAEL